MVITIFSCMLAGEEEGAKFLSGDTPESNARARRKLTDTHKLCPSSHFRQFLLILAEARPESAFLASVIERLLLDVALATTVLVKKKSPLLSSSSPLQCLLLTPVHSVCPSSLVGVAASVVFGQSNHSGCFL